jgi:hypothetical protein
MIDEAQEAQVNLSDNITIAVVEGILSIQGDGGWIAGLGEVTHEKLNELSAAFNNLNQHLFPEKASFDVNAFLASQK